MMRVRICAIVAAMLVAVAWAAGPAHADDFNLVQDGKAIVEIVYDNTPSDYPTPPAEQKERVEESVEDLRNTIERISGAKIAARPSAEAGDADAKNTIQIGLTPAAVRAGLAERAKKLPPHTLIIHSDLENRVLYLVGSTSEGSTHAIYEFLEQLGCRWFMPGSFGEKLPSMKTIAVKPMDLVRTPDFEARGIQLGGVGAVKQGSPIRKEFTDWMRRNKFGGWLPPRGHSFPKLVPEKEYFADHPEYYSLRNGVRTTAHLCLTNPGTLAAAEKYLTEYFTKNPAARGAPVALTDGAQYCECPECTKACGGDPKRIVNLYLNFNRELFDRIDKKFPGREFQYGTYIYSNLLDFPDVPVPHQLAPYIAPLGEDPYHEIADPALYSKLTVTADFPESTLKKIKSGERTESVLFVQRLTEAWGNGNKNIYIRDYDPYLTFSQNMPVFRPYQLAIEIPWYKSIGVRGFTPEAVANSWFSSGINFYARSRLYWDVNADMKAMMQDYCNGMFGKAAEPMYGFLDALARRTIETDESRLGDESLTRVYSIEFVQGLDTYLDKAEALATTEQEKAGVHMWRLCQQHMLKYLETRNAELDGDYAKATALAGEYVKMVDDIHAVNPHFVSNTWYEGRDFNMKERAKQYDQLAARLDGREGTLIARLPARWQFKYDPQDVGMTERWFAFEPSPQANAGEAAPAEAAPADGWKLQVTHDSWQTRKNQYEGYNWYRTQALVPEDARGKDVRMLVGGIFGHMDFFVNGQRVSWQANGLDASGKLALQKVSHLDLGAAWSWNYDRAFDVDISPYLQPGKVNTFAFRTKDKWNWGGIFKNVSLFASNQERPPVYDPLLNQPPLAKLADAVEAVEAEPAEGVNGDPGAAAAKPRNAAKTKPVQTRETIEKGLQKVGHCDCTHTERAG